MKLITDVDLAERFKITVEELHVFRKRYRWPHVKLGRNKVRFTDAQVEQIVARHAETPAPLAKKNKSGQTDLSAKRSA